MISSLKFKEKPLILLIFILVAGVYGCGTDESQKENITAPRLKIKAVTVTAEEADLPVIRSFTGNVRAKVSVQLAAKMSGYVQEVKVNSGDSVKKGDTLLKVDDTEIKSEISALKSTVTGVRDEKKSLRARFDYAQANFQRIEKLFNDGAATLDELEKARSARDELQNRLYSLDARISTIQSKIKAAENRLSYLVIKSPVNGRVTGRNADPGTYVNPGVTLLSVDSSDDGNWFEARVDGSLLETVTKEPKVTVILSDRKITLNAPVSKLTYMIDDQSRTFKVLIDTQDASVTPGDFGRLFIKTAIKKRTVIPSNTVVNRGGLTGVYTVDENNVVAWRVIRTGGAWKRDKEKWLPVSLPYTTKEKELVTEHFIEILSGVSAGEKIVASNLDSMREGSLIE